MKLNVYSVYDKAAKVYSPAFNAQNNAVALRMFDSACKNPDTQVAKYPQDYELYLLAEWDDNTGEYKNVSPVQRIIQAAEMIPPTKKEAK